MRYTVAVQTAYGTLMVDVEGEEDEDEDSLFSEAQDQVVNSICNAKLGGIWP